ncbi:hypothetical protein BJX65DRAFT_105130 [Aspergillus insuetus]
MPVFLLCFSPCFSHVLVLLPSLFYPPRSYARSHLHSTISFYLVESKHKSITTSPLNIEMPSFPKPEDDEPNSSGYEGDISDGSSVNGHGGHESSTTYESTDEETGHNDEPNSDARWFGCSQPDSPPEDVVDALAEGENEDDSRYGIIWIGCSLRDMGLSDYQAAINATYTADIAHIENITLLDGVPAPSEDENEEDEDIEPAGRNRT